MRLPWVALLDIPRRGEYGPSSTRAGGRIFDGTGRPFGETTVTLVSEVPEGAPTVQFCCLLNRSYGKRSTELLSFHSVPSGTTPECGSPDSTI